MTTSSNDRGQAMVAVILVAAVMFMVVSVALLALGGRMIDRTRAQTAADAAALASLHGGRRAAHVLAERHGADLVGFTTDVGRVTVVVRIGDATATAAASDLP